MKFYEFSQNNSGGSFQVDDKLCHRIIIEASTEQDAIAKAENLGCYWDGVANGQDCDCCGDRWYPSSDEVNTNGKTIEQYAQQIAKEYGWTTPDIRIYYDNGDVREIFKDGSTKEQNIQKILKKLDE